MYKLELKGHRNMPAPATVNEFKKFGEYELASNDYSRPCVDVFVIEEKGKYRIAELYFSDHPEDSDTANVYKRAKFVLDDDQKRFVLSTERGTRKDYSTYGTLKKDMQKIAGDDFVLRITTINEDVS